MADGSFDPCECIWNHENNMQRLMNILRNSQSYCADNECVTDMPGPQGDPADGGGFSMMMILMGWIVMATALYLLRPRSLRNQGDSKPSRPAGGGGNNNPPAPPVL